MKMRRKMWRFLSIFLACVMILNYPMSVLASDEVFLTEGAELAVDEQEFTAETDEEFMGDAETEIETGNEMEAASKEDAENEPEIGNEEETVPKEDTENKSEYVDGIVSEEGTESGNKIENESKNEIENEVNNELNAEIGDAAQIVSDDEADLFGDGSQEQSEEENIEAVVMTAAENTFQPNIGTNLQNDFVYTLPDVKSSEIYISLNDTTKDIDGNSLRSIQAEWYKNTEKSYDNAVRFEDGKDGSLDESGDSTRYYFCRPKVTSVLETTYYFCKLTATRKNGTKAYFYSEISSITIQEPEKNSVGIIRGEDAIGKIYVKVEDTVPLREDLTDRFGNPIEDVGPMGILADYSSTGIYVYPSDTMTTVIARACILAGLEIGISGNPGTGMGSYIYMINGREEFDRGADSGWMGSLNGWYTNTGFDNYKIADDTLQVNDYISVKYTTDLGKDIGAAFEGAENTKKLQSLTIEATCNGYAKDNVDFLDGGFDPDVMEYEIAYHSVSMYNNWDGIQISPVAQNQNNRIRVYVDGKECRGRHQAAITNKTTIVTIEVEDPNVEGGDKNPVVYTIRVYKDPELLKEGSVEVIEKAKNGTEYAPEVSYTEYSNVGLGNLFSATMQSDTAVEEYKLASLSITLKNLPENITASIKYKGKTWDVQNGQAILSEGLVFTGERTYTICLKDTVSNTEECYYLRLNKPELTLKKFAFTPMLGSSTAVYTEEFNGQPEGTFFQLGEDGEENGKTGFTSEVTDYRVYVGSFVDGVSFSETSVVKSDDGYYDYMSLWVNGEKIAEGKTMGLMKDKMPLSLKEGENIIAVQVYQPDKEDSINRTYTLHILKKNTTAQELQEKIMTLPNLEDLSYSKDKGTVETLYAMYNSLSEEQKQEISTEAAAKLMEAFARIEELYQQGRAAITELKKLIGTYSGRVTETNYETYEAAVQESQKQLNAMTDWIYSTFVTECKNEYEAMCEAVEIVNKGRILASKTLGEATDYIDDFMVCANAFNLTLEAYEKNPKVYEVNFKDCIASNLRNGEMCLPYNTPGRIKWQIEDETIFRIDSEISVYTDKGLGGGGAKYENELYYMVPLKEGTTTFTVTLTDATGKYYGQTPKMVVHVNSEKEAAIEDLENKLTNINSLPYTRKYDTWYFWEGTEGAEFSFHVNGTEAVVEVLDYQGNGRTAYPVDENGDVTVLLKDGYNPIEVTAVYEGQKVTQVYGLRGKAISYVLTNESRPGMPLKVGDQATIKITGITTPVYKILRIYNPSGANVQYDTDMPYQSVIVGGGTQYSIGALTFTITASGTQTLTNGRIYQRWWGEPLYSETAQGNTGEIAPQADGTFSRIPDISFTVEENDAYVPELKIHPYVKEGTTVTQGQTVTILLEEMDLSEITDLYPMNSNDYVNNLDTAQTFFVTNIPGLEQISSEEYSNSKQNSLSLIKTVKFTIPEDTPDGTYTIKGGYVYVMHGMTSFGIFPDNLFQLEIDDIQIKVEHQCSYDEGKVTKKATCTAKGVKTYTCTKCGKTMTESIAAAGHKYGSWTTVSQATVFQAKVRKHTCSVCKKTVTKSYGSKLTPVLELPGKVTSISMKNGKSVSFTVTMAKGDSVSSAKAASSKLLKVTLDKSAGKVTLKALKTGTTKLTIKLASGKSRTYTVKVVSGTVKTTSLTVTSVTNKKLTLTKGKAHTLKTEVKPFTSTQNCTFKSSNVKVATVTSKGKIQAIAPGKATITVTSGSVSVKITVTVPGITIAKTSVTVKKNKTLTLEPKLYGISDKVSYTTSDSKVATVTSKGKVKGIKKGTAKITIKAGNYKKTVTVKVQ